MYFKEIKRTMDCALSLEITSEMVKRRAPVQKLKYNNELNRPTQRTGNIGGMSILLQDLIYAPSAMEIEKLHQYWRELQEWVQIKNSSNPDKYLEVYLRPDLNWTSEKFDFMLSISKIDKHKNRKIDTIYLIDLFLGPDNNALLEADSLLCHPKTIGFLRKKLFQLTAEGLDLKETYKQDAQIRHFHQRFSVPITEQMVRMVERDYYFNTHLPVNLNPESGKFHGITCKYGSLRVNSQTPVSVRMENWIFTGVAERELAIGPKGPSWLCTLTKMLKEKGQYHRHAQIYDIDGKWRTVIVD